MIKIRHRILRFDIWLCMLIAFFAAYGVTYLMQTFLIPKQYEAHTTSAVIPMNEIGAMAGEDVLRVDSIEDMLSADTFTILSPNLEYRNIGMGFASVGSLYAITLPSGEIVPGMFNGSMVQSIRTEEYGNTSVLPVGKVVWMDLSKEDGFMNQINSMCTLSRSDFYIDMVGTGGVQSLDNYSEKPILIAQFVTFILIFLGVHYLGAKFGILPQFFNFPQKQSPSEWE